MAKDELLVQRIFYKPSSEPMPHSLKRQVVAKVLTPAEFEFGSQPRHLSRYRYAPEDMILCRKNVEEWVLFRNPIELLMVTVPEHVLHSIAAEMGAEPNLSETPCLRDQRVCALVAAAEAEFAHGFPAGRIYMDSIGHALAAALLQSRGILRKVLRKYRGGIAPAPRRRVTTFVHENLDQDLSLMQMAEKANLSPAYFSQMFRQSTGVAPHQFVLRARVRLAKELLIKQDTRILDIAVACGFQTQQHFARVFRAFCKMSPTQYRRMNLT
jgi:AraC family transcriptional regulator